jgi:hypothetical protein
MIGASVHVVNPCGTYGRRTEWLSDPVELWRRQHAWENVLKKHSNLVVINAPRSSSLTRKSNKARGGVLCKKRVISAVERATFCARQAGRFLRNGLAPPPLKRNFSPARFPPGQSPKRDHVLRDPEKSQNASSSLPCPFGV